MFVSKIKIAGLLLATSVLFSCGKDYTTKEIIIQNMKRVADYELAHPSVHYSKNDTYNYPSGWVPSTFYLSLLPLYEATNDVKYKEVVEAWTKKVNYKCAPRVVNPDDMICGQTFLDYYKYEKKEEIVADLVVRLDTLMAIYHEKNSNWRSSNTLFMGPPVFMAAGDILNEPKYIDYADNLFWGSHHALFDPKENLFYRDTKSRKKYAARKQKSFWSRGNGYVLAALARIIPHIEDRRRKDKYIGLFEKMAVRIGDLQQSNGLWTSDLINSDKTPNKETSGSALNVYALTWGINNGILSSEKFTPIVKKGWNALNDCVNEQTGMLGFVQPIGAAPGNTQEDITMSYGAMGFILAGTEMLELVN